MTTHRTCDGINRRDFIRIGALAGTGLTLSSYLSMAEAGEISEAQGKSAIFVRLAGGPSHLDTFDMKPEAPDTHRGEFRDIATKTSGVRISEHLPLLAKCTDRFAILRGVSHNLGAHALGTLYLTSGNRPLPSLRYPTYGTVVSKELGSGRPDLPPYVAIPNDVAGDATGFLGVEFGALSTGAVPKAGRPLEVRGLTLPRGVTLADIDRRQDLLSKYDTAFDELGANDSLLNGLDRFSQRAYAMLRSETTREAFDVSKESAVVRERFGEESFPRACLLATRLVESGVRFVTLNLGGWDTHQQNFPKLKDQLLPNLDRGLAGLFTTLAEKGLLESTAVFVTGEFGRTPKVNKNAGRDHYPRAMFCLLAGGGVRGGQVIGESDAKGEGPKGTGITPDDVAATFYSTLGIDVTKEYQTPSGRPVMIVRHGKPIRAAFS